MDKTFLLEQAKSFKGCKDGVKQLKGCKTTTDFINCYYERIDFCLKNNFPTNEYIKRIYRNEIEYAGIYVDRKYNLINRERLVVLGKCDINATYTDYTVARIYVKHNSMLQINASGNAYIVVDALDESVVRVVVKGDAKVIVNLYANAECLGATKVISKNMDTYEL